MLEFGFAENKWNPTDLSGEEIRALIDSTSPQLLSADYCLIIFQARPFIDSILLSEGSYVARFAFHEDYVWSRDDEELFERACLLNPMCRYTVEYLDEIFEIYSSEYPELHLNRYYTASLKMLDHIYHCLKKNTAKEMLYKAGLDVLAANFCYGEHVNLLATKPSDLYGGLSIKVLRALNCEEGAHMLAQEKYYEHLWKLQSGFPDIFKESLNNAQAAYIRKLIDGNLTISELGRLYHAAKERLSAIWIKSQYDIFLDDIRRKEEEMAIVKALIAIDPIYSPLEKHEVFDRYYHDGTISELKHYLVLNRHDYDKRIRRSNRKRPDDWQENFARFIFRYPQSINDFCREGFYMQNCLMSYAEAVLENDTTIIFMRPEEYNNQPFITMEVFTRENGKSYLEQAYHRFNEDCNEFEATIIRAYCERHGIIHDEVHFDKTIDLGGGF